MTGACYNRRASAETNFNRTEDHHVCQPFHWPRGRRPAVGRAGLDLLFEPGARRAAATAPAGALRLDAATLWVVAPDEPEALQRAARRGERLVQGFRPAAKRGRQAAGEMVGPGAVFRSQRPLAQGARRAAVRRSRSASRCVWSGCPAGRRWSRRAPICAARSTRPTRSARSCWASTRGTSGSTTSRRPSPTWLIPAAYARQWGPPRFKYRGWFINDEDLLSRFAPAPLQDGVFSLEMWDRIYETLLRLRANTIVPGTFTFPDERMQVLAARRGLINSQHHICVVGLNTFQWPAEFPYSYLTHPGTLEQAWQVCVDAMKDREAVWTVGFRGRHDRAFWADDPQVKTPEARGRLISEAIARQVEMVRRVQPQADCIANLWVEGVDLYKAGYLKLAAGRDPGLARRRGRLDPRPGRSAPRPGHLLSHGDAQRASQPAHRDRAAGADPPGADPLHQGRRDLLLRGQHQRRAAGPLDHRLLHAPGLGRRRPGQRPTRPPSATSSADWSRRQFGDAAADALAPLYGDYFATPYIQAGLGENKTLREIQRLVRYAMAAASPRKMPVKLARSLAAEYRPSTEHLAELAPKVRAMVDRVPAERRDFYRGHLVVQVEVHHRLCNVLEDLCAAIVALGATAGLPAVRLGARVGKPPVAPRPAITPQAVDQLDTAWPNTTH